MDGGSADHAGSGYLPPAGDPVAASGFIAGVARGAGSYSLLFRVQRPVHVVVAVIQFGEWPQNYFFTAF